MFSESKQQEIRQVFQKEIECAHMLLRSLDQEYEVLVDHHVDTLEEIVRDKQERIEQLELISKLREKLLASSDGVILEKNYQQSKHYSFSGNKQLAELWSELVSVAEKCRDKNRINGSIVELVSKQSRHALDILQGILPGTSPISELYDSVGHTTKSVNKRSLVQV